MSTVLLLLLMSVLTPSWATEPASEKSKSAGAAADQGETVTISRDRLELLTWTAEEYRKKYHEEQRAHRNTAYRDSLAMDTREKQHAIEVDGLKARLPAWHEDPDLRFLVGALAMALMIEVTVAR